jgi:DNA helicase-2/ATP-dependent DNA helicase PcrA
VSDRRYKLETRRAPVPSKLDLEHALNPAQLEAVETEKKRVLILAGAGSGKTRTLTYRVARLLEKGAPPEGIVLATFTNRAAREMIGRIESLLGGAARRVRAGTFHALGFETLRRHAEAVGYKPGFSIIDREDQTEAMSAAVGEIDVDVKARRFPGPETLVQMLSLSINTDAPLEKTIARRFIGYAPLEPLIARVFEAYARKKIEMNVMDFDDLLLHWKALLVETNALAFQLKSAVHHVLVDEFQDTNKLQAEIAELLASECRSLSVVGDDAQSIYSFRGARFDNILEFPLAEPTDVHRLTINYRSVPEVLKLANEIIKRNPLQFPKDLEAHRKSGVLPVLVPAKDTIQQAEFIAQRVLELRDEGVPLNDQAVLYRAHSHSIELQIELAKRDVPFFLRSGTRFFEQAHTKDMLAFLRVVQNPRDELSLRRVLRVVPGVGTKTESKIFEAVKVGGFSAWRAPAFVESLPMRARDAFSQLTATFEALSSDALRDRPGEMIRILLDGTTSLLHLHIESQYKNPKDRIEELRQLADIASQHADLTSFLAEVTLVAELSGEDQLGGDRETEHLVLSTVHQAKGLEWRAVFVAGLSDGAFPHATSLDEDEGEAEERRLLYVAVTRAMEQLYLCYPGSRYVREGERVLVRPSRFISEIASMKGLFEKWLLE